MSDAQKIVEQLIMWQLKNGYITKMNMMKMMHHLKKESKTQDKEALEKFAEAQEQERKEYEENKLQQE